MAVYVMQDAESGRVKIGFSRNPEKRLANLRTYIYRLALVCYGEGDHIMEKRWHRYFADKRVFGEWFSLSGDDLRLLQHRVPLNWSPPLLDRSPCK